MLRELGSLVFLLSFFFFFPDLKTKPSDYKKITSDLQACFFLTTWFSFGEVASYFDCLNARPLTLYCNNNNCKNLPLKKPKPNYPLYESTAKVMQKSFNQQISRQKRFPRQPYNDVGSYSGNIPKDHLGIIKCRQDGKNNT